MNENNPLRTTRSKGYILYLVLMMVLPLAFSLLFFLLGEIDGLTIAIYVICGIFFVLGLFLLIDTLLSYVEVRDDILEKRVFFFVKSAKIKEITKITRSEGYYNIYVREKLFCSLPDPDTTTDKMLNRFQSKGIDIGKIEYEEKRGWNTHSSERKEG